MIKINLDMKSLSDDQRTWLESWLEVSKRETERLNSAQEVSFNPKVWRDLKVWLAKEIFGSKCAYCEWKLGRSFGTMDHLRPKSRVTELDENGKWVAATRADGELHPGYFWLAYNLYNLFPVCDHCNIGGGKLDRFPIASVRVYDPSDLTDASSLHELDEIEQPLLLNPYLDDPALHLIFGANGVIAPRTDRGAWTIRIAGLDEGGVEAERKAIQGEVGDAIALAYFDAARNNRRLEEGLIAVKEKFLSRDSEFAAAARAEYFRRIENLNFKLTEADLE